jgi:hypothetical protein
MTTFGEEFDSFQPICGGLKPIESLTKSSIEKLQNNQQDMKIADS